MWSGLADGGRRVVGFVVRANGPGLAERSMHARQLTGVRGDLRNDSSHHQALPRFVRSHRFLAKKIADTHDRFALLIAES